ncbi:hypothetical protein HYS49_03060 [Candidatus Woesearchaeota archaeon]|nr:hypothetical protein [Candidatus Woesearchaeota archaeon]
MKISKGAAKVLMVGGLTGALASAGSQFASCGISNDIRESPEMQRLDEITEWHDGMEEELSACHYYYVWEREDVNRGYVSLSDECLRLKNEYDALFQEAHAITRSDAYKAMISEFLTNRSSHHLLFIFGFIAAIGAFAYGSRYTEEKNKEKDRK